MGTTGVPTVQAVKPPSPYIENPGCTGPDGIFYPWNPTQFATFETASEIAQGIADMLKQKVDVVDTNAGMQRFVPNCACYQIRLVAGAMFNAGLLYKSIAQGDPQKTQALNEVTKMKSSSQPYNFIYVIVASFGPE